MTTSEAEPTTALDRQTPAPPPPGRSRRRRALLIGGVIAAVVAAGTVSAVAIVNANHVAAVELAEDAHGALLEARQANAAITTSLEVDVAAAIEQRAAVDKIVEAHDYFDEKALAEVAAARNDVVDELEPLVDETDDAVVPAVAHLELGAAPAPVDATTSNDELAAEAASFDKLTDRADRDTAAKTAVSEALNTATGALYDELVALEETVKTSADALVGAAGSADQPSKDALQAVVTKLTEAGEAGSADLANLQAYIEAVKAVQASHAAAEAQKAAEAQRRADESGEGYTDDDGTYYPPSGDGGGGGGTGGGGGDGGGGGVPIDTNRYINTNSFYVPYSSCPGGGYVIGGHDPGPGGTSAPGFTYPWSFTGGGSSGFTFYAC